MLFLIFLDNNLDKIFDLPIFLGFGTVSQQFISLMLPFFPEAKKVEKN